MSNTPEENVDADEKIPPWASGTHLRRIEETVLIPNLMKVKAKVICKEYLDAFAGCCDGRFVSLAWKCRKEKDALQDCLDRELKKPELFEESKKEYLAKREDFQTHYAKTGEKRKKTDRLTAFTHVN